MNHESERANRVSCMRLGWGDLAFPQGFSHKGLCPQLHEVSVMRTLGEALWQYRARKALLCNIHLWKWPRMCRRHQFWLELWGTGLGLGSSREELDEGQKSFSGGGRSSVVSQRVAGYQIKRNEKRKSWLVRRKWGSNKHLGPAATRG